MSDEPLFFIIIQPPTKRFKQKNPESLSTFRILREQFLTVVHPQGLEPWTH